MATEAQDDKALLERWQRGDASAGNALFDRHFDAICRFFERRAPADEVADLVQKTFLACVEAIERFRRASSFRSFLFGIARVELLAYYRKQHGAPVDLLDSSVADLTKSPSSLARARDELQRLNEALRSIPADLQMALELHYWEELSGPELADALDIPEGTVRSRLRRGKEALLAKLVEMETPSHQSKIAPDELERQLAAYRPR